MLKTNLIRVLCLICLLPVCLWGSGPVFSEDAAPVADKVSSQLQMHIQMKTRQTARISCLEQSAGAANQVELPTSESDPDLTTEQVFLRLAEQPSPEQIADLADSGISVYADSWIPPVGNFKTGIVLAAMPLDKLDELASRDYVLEIDTAEVESLPQNDLGREALNVAPVWSSGNRGAGITVAVLDSGIEAANADFPLLDATNSRDYSNYPALDETITNTVTGHGTHVAGSVLGRGVNSALYQGVAPESDLVFLKIGNDSSGGATYAAEAGAILAAVDVYHADIITMSYGGWSDYHDGTNAVCQAIDYAVSRGVTVFMSAGNRGNDQRHYSGSVPAAGTTDFIQVNVTGAGDNDTALFFNLVWFDGLSRSRDLDLQYFDSAYNPLDNIYSFGQSESLRGTESEYTCYYHYLPPGDGTYYLKVRNLSSASQFFHIYDDWGQNITFEEADPFYTIGSPAEADGAIAVGAYVTRTEWTDYQGNPQTNVTTQTLGEIATFSSRGPRVDPGAPLKPDIVAPGSRIISVRDNDVYPWPAYNTAADIYPYAKFIIDNDGLNQDGSGPADYLVMQGTSMAAPLAAGTAALVLNAHPDYTPYQVRQALFGSSADQGESGPDYIYGHGLIDTAAAIDYTLPLPQGAGGEVAAVDKAATGRTGLLILTAGLLTATVWRLKRRRTRRTLW